MSKNTKVYALEVIIKHETRHIYDRVRQWFREHPDEPYCYWAKDDFIAIKDKDNEEILRTHPEIDDINDHTLVHYDPAFDIVLLDKFCPRLKQSIKELLGDKDRWTATYDGVTVSITPSNGNYEARLYAES